MCITLAKKLKESKATVAALCILQVNCFNLVELATTISWKREILLYCLINNLNFEL
jgi:hypothetical protein